MQKQQTIECAFCKGVGKHPHFGGTCPVCKGKGKNTVVGPFIACRDCRGSGQKRGTTLTCYTCAGLGVLPDTREIVAKARKEIKEAREEMEKEKQEFGEGSQSTKLSPKAGQPFAGKKRTRKKVDKKKEIEETLSSNEGEDPNEELFCQRCGSKVKKESMIKVCLGCFQRIKDLWRENIFTPS